MSYDRLAPFYTLLETAVFGWALQQARCAALGGAAPGRVLIIGDGNGRFLERAVIAWPGAEFVCIDASAGMLRIARRRPGKNGVKFVHADVTDGLSALEDESFDAVVTHFFLDCFREKDLAVLIPKISAKLGGSGAWYVSEFTGERRLHRTVLWVMYRFFGTFTETPARRLPGYSAALRGCGFEVELIGSWRSGLIIAEAWTRAKSL